jgi:hypothetical protein
MSEQEKPFSNIESAHEYVGLLTEAIDESRQTIDEQMALAEAAGAARRVEALRIVAFKMTRLREHLVTSQRLLNDLLMLRRLLLQERPTREGR